jgi:hypothetical protein
LSSGSSLNGVSIPEDLFKGFGQLTQVDFRELNIQQLPENVFDVLPDLSALSLNLKSLDTSKITSRLFEKITRLSTL